MIKLNVILKNPEYTQPGGDILRLTNEPVSVLVATPATCEHEETVCPECAEDWAQDWDIVGAVLFTADGATNIPWEEWP